MILVEGLGDFGYRQDNPAVRDGEQGKEWLLRKQEYAIEMAKGRSSGGAKRLFSGAITAAMGLKPMYLSSSLLDAITGCNDEWRRPGESQYDRLLQQVDENGFDLDPHNAVLVGVNQLGEAYVLEGNTRAAVAKAKGIKSIPVEFKWFNGGELVDGDYTPAKIAEMASTSP